jgi:hypothetical protein
MLLGFQFADRAQYSLFRQVANFHCKRLRQGSFLPGFRSRLAAKSAIFVVFPAADHIV